MYFMGRRSKPPPCEFVTPTGTWPDGPFDSGAPAYVEPLAVLAQRLAQVAIERGLTQRGLAAATGVNLNTINYTLAGKVIPDTATLALLEQSLNERFWP